MTLACRIQPEADFAQVNAWTAGNFGSFVRFFASLLRHTATCLDPGYALGWCGMSCNLSATGHSGCQG
jgi:hypothetical protein